MKISEKLTELKQKEGQLMRLFNLRDEVLTKQFAKIFIKTEDMTKEEFKEEEKLFLEEKKQKYERITKEIKKLIEEIVEGKNQLNKKNVELNIDKKLAELKFIRLELSKIMGVIKKDRFGLSGSLDIDVFEQLGLPDRIKELEARKAKLDNTIQQINWLTEL